MGVKHDPPLVLVADDEVNAAIMLRHIFEREGYQVESAHDGETALSMAQRLQPDLILLDIQMPGLNGFEVLRRLREKSFTSGIPTIVVSARAREPDDIAMGLNIGADDYISKPFAPQELLARARSKMRARQLDEALQQRTRELEALLRVSEELNRHLEVDELFSLVLYLVLDLLPGEVAIIYQFDEDGHVAAYRSQSKNPANPVALSPPDVIAQRFHECGGEVIWPEGNVLEPGFENGIAIALQHGDNPLGMLMVANNHVPFDTNQQLLFRGVCRQAALALHNAELYAIQANYAQSLEDMVEARTEELKHTQQMLFRSEKLASIGHLAASIAHEINNPLQPIRLNLEYMLEDVDAGEQPDAEVINMTQQSVERISRIVSQLLEFTKSSAETEFESVDVPGVIQSVLRLNERVFQREQIAIETDFQPVPKVSASKDQLEQVFMNMVINARAAMKPGGRLRAQVWSEDQVVKVQFKDTGSGIPEDLLNKIFDPFVSTKKDGTGLGLFVSYGIIENHHGSIEVKSKINSGTTFTITLPVSQAQTAN